jgi:hypothetical protein
VTGDGEGLAFMGGGKMGAAGGLYRLDSYPSYLTSLLCLSRLLSLYH